MYYLIGLVVILLVYVGVAILHKMDKINKEVIPYRDQDESDVDSPPYLK